jgi:hypothetical protein
MRLLIGFSVLLAAVVPAALGQHKSDPPFVSCTNTDQRIEMIVVATRVPASATTTENLVWAIKEMPGDDKIIVCKKLKANIKRALEQTSPGAGNFKVADGRPFDEYLLAEVNGLEQVDLPGGLSAPPLPADVGKEFKVVLCLTTDPEACAEAPAQAQRARIEIATGTIDPTLPLPPDVHVFDTSSGPVPVKLFYSDEDLAAARKDPAVISDEQAHERVRSELLKVAEVAHAEAVKSGGLGTDGKPVFTGIKDEQVNKSDAAHTNKINELYLLVGGIFAVNWLKDVKPNLKCNGCEPGSTQTPVWVWSVSGLRLVEGVNIEVVEEDWETGQSSPAAAKLRKRRQTAYDKLNGPARPSLNVNSGHIASRADIEGEKGDLALLNPLVEAVDKVKSGPVVTPSHPVAAVGAPPGHNIIYAVRRRKKPELNLAFKVGGSYSKEEGGTGHVGVEEGNLLLLKETIALSAEGGGEVQKYRFSFTRPFERSGEPGFEIRDFSINAQVFKDKDKRLGNLTADEIAAREVGSSANLSFGYDSIGARDRLNENCITDAARLRTRFSFLTDVGLNYRDVNIPEDDKLLSITGIGRDLLPRERTQTTTLSLGINALLRHDFRKPKANGLGVLVIRLDETAQKGFHLFGADYRYWKSRTVAVADLTFGFSSSRDMFVGYRHGHERSSEGTPVFELPLLGGAESVRGLEEGEFIGRRVSFDQFELGLNIASMWNLFTHKGRLEDSVFCPFDPESKPPAGPFDFKNLYLKGFFDQGRLSDSPVAAASGGALRRADGYGIALELRDLVADESGRRVNLSIGYGRSPHSRLHRSGMIVTRVTLEF